MRTMRSPRIDAGQVGIIFFVAAGTLFSGVFCGGGLSYKVDDATLDAVPSSERQAVFDARRDVEIAQGEKRTAASLLDSLERDRDFADKEKQQAQLEVEKANAEQESAVLAKDENRHAAANHGKEVASLGLKAAEAKLDWLAQKKTWLKETQTAAEAHVAAAEARVELEKAKVAKQKGLKPSDDFDLGKFESQAKDRASGWESAKKDAASEEKSAKSRQETWQDLVSQHSKSRGS